MNAIASRITKIFTENFSSVPACYYSPGRINLIGEHIDYNDGYVLPAAINKGIYYAIAANNTSDIHCYAADLNEWLSVSITEVQKMNGWKNYVLSVVNEFLLLGKQVKGFNCAFGGDIPAGSGMSSSAAVEGGLAFAINEIFDTGLNRVELALLCQRAEHNFPHVNCGIMDQFANMMGKTNHVILLDCKDLSYQYFPLKMEGYRILLLNSRVHHSLASGEYNKRRKECEEGLAILQKNLGIQSFRDIKKAESLASSRNKTGETVYKRCLYVVEEIQRTQKAASLLNQNDLVEFGKLMYATHEGLSKLYEVSCAELDFLADCAKKNNSVAGARMMGGGFGGCTINIIRQEAVDDFIHETGNAYKEKFHISPEPYLVETSDGTSKIS